MPAGIPDEGVRNNATRVVRGMVGSSGKLARMIPTGDFIDMRNSGTWVDRNKRSALLVALSKFRDPKLLAESRARGMPGLIEIARWDQGHAMTRIILPPWPGVHEASLEKLVGER